MAEYVTTEQFERFLKEEVDHHKRSERAGEERGKEIQEIGRKVDSVVKWRPTVDEQNRLFRKTLFGNGEPGWDEILRRLVAYVNHQEEKEKEVWSDAKKFAIGIAVFILNSIITIILARMFGG